MMWVGRLVLIDWTGFLSGSGPTGEDELRQWMADQLATTKPRITPLTDPKQFQPQAYTGESGNQTFNQIKLTPALRRDFFQVASNGLVIAPEMARRKESLEAFPLDAMTMVGSLNKTGTPTALLKVDNLLYQVRLGNYLGQHYGQITKLSATAVELREIVQDATGDLMERTASLDLQEGKK